MYQLVLLIHVFAAIFIIALVLIQQGKGAAMGAAFGSGASQTIFGSRGSGSFLFRLTLGFAAIFFATSIFLNYLVTKEYKTGHAITMPLSVPQPNEPVNIPQNVPNNATKTPPPPVLPSEIPTKQQ